MTGLFLLILVLVGLVPQPALLAASGPALGSPAPTATVTVESTGKVLSIPAGLMGQAYALIFFSYG